MPSEDREAEIKSLLAQHKELAEQWEKLLAEEARGIGQNISPEELKARQLKTLEAANRIEVRLKELGHNFE